VCILEISPRPLPLPLGKNIARHDLGENTSLGIRKRRKFDKKEERWKRKGEFNLKEQIKCTNKGMKSAWRINICSSLEREKYNIFRGEGGFVFEPTCRSLRLTA
jgi:hypothetical protein